MDVEGKQEPWRKDPGEGETPGTSPRSGVTEDPVAHVGPED